MESHPQRFRLHDVAEIAVGAVLLGFPVAVTEEVWQISRNLSTVNCVFVSLASVTLLAWFGYYMFYRTNPRTWNFVLRVSSVYIVTLGISAVILIMIDKFPLQTEPVVAVKRMIIVAFPASFSATVLDSVGSSQKK